MAREAIILGFKLYHCSYMAHQRHGLHLSTHGFRKANPLPLITRGLEVTAYTVWWVE